MATTQLEQEEVVAPQEDLSIVDLQQFRAELSEAGQELFDIIFGAPDDPAALMTQDEILAELARRR